MLLTVAAADTPAMEAHSYTLRFTMNPDAYPAADQPIVSGLADMLNMLTVSGTYTTDGTAFDNDMILQLGSHKDTATALRIYGYPDRWWVESNLLGDELLLINNVALLEFGMKAYTHMNMPLQYPLLLINPYVHTSAFEWIAPEWQSTFGGSGSRTIAFDDLYSLACYISENGEVDRAFLFWVYALTRESGFEYDVLDALYFLPDWVEGVVDPEGIVITVDGNTETWMNGEEMLFTRTVDGEDESWMLTLPMSDTGHIVEASFDQTETKLSFTLIVTAYDPGDTLHVAVEMTQSGEAFPASGTTTLSVDMTGTMVVSPVSLRLSSITDGSSFIITQSDAVTGMPMLTVSGTQTKAVPAETGVWTMRASDEGVNILSVNDASLASFLGTIIGPMVQGAWPLLVHLPASTFASAYDLLNQYGVLDIVIYSLQ